MIGDVETVPAVETPKVLIVDDQPRNLDALEAMLEPTGCMFIRAQSADEALLSLLRHDFAAIVLDIKMPGMNGLELATLIKQRKRSRHVPILFLTAHMVDDREALQGYGVGGVDYLSKPINAEILRSKVGVFIELYRKTRALADLNEALEREVADRERAQEALESVNRELETRVRARTDELTMANRGLREGEERLRMAMDVSRIGAWEWNLASGRMTWSTDPEVLFGFPAGCLGADHRLAGAIHHEDRPRNEAALVTALASGAYETAYRAVRPDGSVLWLTERGQIVRDAEGKPERMVGITRDVTSEREAEQQREKLLLDARVARAEAEMANRAKDDFLAVLSHELRTPLNAVFGYARLLQAKQLDEDGRARAVDAIVRNTNAQVQLIDELLDVSRVISGKLRLDLRSVDLGKVVEAALDTVRPAADTKGLRIQAVLDPDAGPVAGDPDRLQQVVCNLLMNAVKFTPGDGRIQVRLQRVNSHVEIVVSDTGEGIAPNVLPFIFDRFRQGDSSSTRRHGGLGLGLALVKHLVELHGGQVAAHSDGVGRGATFLVNLPLSIAKLPSHESLLLHSMSRSRTTEIGEARLDGIRIIVVDDDKDSGELMTTILNSAGAVVRGCRSASEALNAVREWQPDVLVSDIEMPDEDGYWLISKVRALDTVIGRKLPAVALTAHGRREDRIRSLTAGYSMHVAKPVDPGEFTTVIASLAGRSPSARMPSAD
jgi:PAS domain S-box-containing protein